MNERKARALIEEHFAEALLPAKFKKLWEHVSACQGCKAHYDKLFAFESRLDAGKAEVERIGESLFAAMEPEKKGLLDGVFAFTWPFPRVIAAGAAALVLALVLVPQIVKRSPGPSPIAADSEFAERSGGTVPYGPSLLATCFRDVSGKIESPTPLGIEPAPACPRGGRIVFAYRDARVSDQLTVLAQRGRDVTVLVWPTPLEAGPGKRPMQGSFAIDAEAPEGEVKLVAVFGQGLDAKKIVSALEEGREASAAAGENALVRSLSYRLEKK
ncbi:MAG TPA: hypothetical protein VGK67_00055 [Myxococcales bacterium]|jgi:hypothetical protein